MEINSGVCSIHYYLLGGQIISSSIRCMDCNKEFCEACDKIVHYSVITTAHNRMKLFCLNEIPLIYK